MVNSHGVHTFAFSTILWSSKWRKIESLRPLMLKWDGKCTQAIIWSKNYQLVLPTCLCLNKCHVGVLDCKSVITAGCQLCSPANCRTLKLLIVSQYYSINFCLVTWSLFGSISITSFMWIMLIKPLKKIPLKGPLRILSQGRYWI